MAQHQHDERVDDAPPPEVGSFPAWWAERPDLPEAAARVGWGQAKDAWVASWHAWVRARPRSLTEITRVWETFSDDDQDDGLPDPRIEQNRAEWARRHGDPDEGE